MVQIKAADGREADLAALRGLLKRRDVDPATRARIEREVRIVAAGAKGERDAAYEIEFHFGRLAKRATIHDLRLEVDGRVAQIDHLIIDRLLTIWVCESKHFAEGVGVNDHGEWVRYIGGRPHGMASPIEQNRRHIEVLRDVFDRGLVELPRRLGVTVKPDLRSVVLVSNVARISRPRSKAPAEAAGMDHVIKVERLKAILDADRETTSLLALRKVVSTDTVERIGRELAALHQPAPVVDWAARFGLGPTPIPAPSVVASQSGRGRASGRSCEGCGRPVSVGVARYSEEHPERFGGRILCMDCQRDGA